MVGGLASELLPVDDEDWKEEKDGQMEISQELVKAYLVIKGSAGPISMMAISGAMGGGPRSRTGRTAIGTMVDAGIVELLPTYPPMYRLRDTDSIPAEGQKLMELLEQAIGWFGFDKAGA